MHSYRRPDTAEWTERPCNPSANKSAAVQSVTFLISHESHQRPSLAFRVNITPGGCMKKLITKFMAMCLLSVSLAAFAQSGDTKQDEMKQDDMKQDQMKHDDMKKDDMKKDEMKKDKKSKKSKKAKKDEMKHDEMKHDDMSKDDTKKN